MLQKSILSFLAICLLSACTSTNPRDFLKSSANNKLFDTKGFKGGKRAPLYNKKYISKAKKNVAKYDDEYDFDEDDEQDENTYKKNKAIYKEMVEHEIQQENRKNRRWYQPRKKIYPNLSESRKNFTTEDHSERLELKDELDQIKSMLQETRRELENSKCPTSNTIEKQTKSPSKENLSNSFEQTQSI